MIPSIAGQSTPFGFWPCIWNTCSSRLIWLAVSSRWVWKPCLSCGSVALSIIVGSAFVIWFSA